VGKDSTKYQGKEGPDHNAVPMKLLIRLENICDGYSTIKEDLILFRQFPWISFLHAQLPGVHTILSSDITVNCYCFVPMHLQSLVACSSMTETKLVSRAESGEPSR